MCIRSKNRKSCLEVWHGSNKNTDYQPFLGYLDRLCGTAVAEGACSKADNICRVCLTSE